MTIPSPLPRRTMSSSFAWPHNMGNLDNPDNLTCLIPIRMKCPYLLIMTNSSCLLILMTTPLLILIQSAPSLPPEITHAFHSTIDGKLSSLSLNIYYLIITGIPGDENREPLPNGTPPPRWDTNNGPNDWFLYGSQAKFELCNLLYRKSNLKMPVNQVMNCSTL